MRLRSAGDGRRVGAVAAGRGRGQSRLGVDRSRSGLLGRRVPGRGPLQRLLRPELGPAVPLPWLRGELGDQPACRGPPCCLRASDRRSPRRRRRSPRSPRSGRQRECDDEVSRARPGLRLSMPQTMPIRWRWTTPLTVVSTDHRLFASSREGPRRRACPDRRSMPVVQAGAGARATWRRWGARRGCRSRAPGQTGRAPRARRDPPSRPCRSPPERRLPPRCARPAAGRPISPSVAITSAPPRAAAMLGAARPQPSSTTRRPRSDSPSSWRARAIPLRQSTDQYGASGAHST